MDERKDKKPGRKDGDKVPAPATPAAPKQPGAGYGKPGDTWSTDPGDVWGGP
jgi:hypothetical protein